jgi:hypothetical protein
MNFKFLKAAVTGLILTVSSFANAGLITSVSDSELNTSTLIDFSAYTSGSANQITFAGGEFNTTGNFGFSVWNNYGTSGGAFYNIGHSTAFTLTFDNVVSAFGMNIGAIHSSWTWDVYDINNLLIDTISFANDNGAGAFYGYSASNIKSVVLTPVNDQAAFDNLHFVSGSTDVPEPSTLAIFALAIMGLSARHFKKQ